MTYYESEIKTIPTLKNMNDSDSSKVWKLTKTETAIRKHRLYYISSHVRGKSLTDYFEVKDFIT